MTKKVPNVSEVGEGGWGLSHQSRTKNTLEMTLTVLFVGPKKHVFFWGQKQMRPQTPRNGICVVFFFIFVGPLPRVRPRNGILALLGTT